MERETTERAIQRANRLSRKIGRYIQVVINCEAEIKHLETFHQHRIDFLRDVIAKAKADQLAAENELDALSQGERGVLNGDLYGDDPGCFQGGES